MTPERWQQIEQLYEAYLDHAPEGREQFLSQACAETPDLRADLESLLAMQQEDPAFWEGSFAGTPARPAHRSPRLEAGDRIGPYRLVCPIGRGGMGQVYLAERDKPFRQRVAMKVIRRGHDTEDLLRRFDAERQILAGLSHPNIARLLDGGTTPDGRPFLVMEYVEGEPITTYCDRHQLSIDDRLRLFQSVCAAVQYAHQNLIVHRDLKPSNILVSEDGSVKLLDFGIAKLLDAEQPGFSVPVTRPDVLLMTPEYASPEQVQGASVTTVSDVYALGVLLYELLAGRRPYRVPSRLRADMERLICEEAPQRPSTAIRRLETRVQGDGIASTPAQVSQARGTRPDRLERKLRGDLDNIVLMAMRKEPERRYASAQALSEDLQRHLGGLPVQARSDTVLYRLRKFAGRHALGVATAALLVLMLVGFSAVTAIQSAQIQAKAEEAGRARDNAEQVAEFLVSLFEASDPGTAQGQTITAEELLERGAARVERDLAGQPDMQAAMMNVMGEAYEKLGLYERAQPLIENALSLRQSLHGAEHLDVAESLNDLAVLLRARGDYSRAEPLLREALAINTTLLGEDHETIAVNLSNLGLLLQYKGDYAAAEPLLRRALAIDRQRYQQAHPSLARSLDNLGWLLEGRGNYAAAESLYQESLAMFRTLYKGPHPDVALLQHELARIFETEGDYAAAESLYQASLAMKRTLFEEAHPDLSITLHNLARVLHARGRYAAAAPLYHESIAIDRQLLGEEHPFTAIGLNSLALLLRDQGDQGEAERLFGKALAVFKQKLPEGHPYLAHPLLGLGQLRIDQGRPGEAEPLLREALAIRRDKFGEADGRTAEAQVVLGRCLTAQARYAEAEVLLKAGHALLQEQRGPAHPLTQQARQALETLYQQEGAAPTP